MKDEKDYYLTTAITYTSGKPHIGNTYEIILADAIARFKRQEGYNVRFQTGTDEHGQKIEIKHPALNHEEAIDFTLKQLINPDYKKLFFSLVPPI